jgi:hypothetical protein
VSTPPAIRSRPRLALRLVAVPALAAAALCAAPACHKPAYVVEGRSSPVHVIVEAPAAAADRVQANLRVTVGDRIAVDGLVVFPAGRTRVDLPTVTVPAGPRDVDVLVEGRPAAHSTANVGHATWIRVTLTGGGGATVLVFATDPSGAR